jgi:hypothetical protein
MAFRLRLPCALFGHRIVREPVWNQGFYFATCGRCEQEVVRIPGENWHRPRHAHVIWSTSEPAAATRARLQRHKSAPLQPWTELPASTRISGSMTRDIRQGRQRTDSLTEQRRSAIPDFMDDPLSPLDPFAETHSPEGADERRAPAPRPIRAA